MPHNKAYLRAEKKIKEALKSGATELDLQNMKLTELPESVGQLTQLQSLNLSYNQLTTLPVSLKKLSRLQTLDLTNNPIQSLPNWIGRLIQLHEVRTDFSTKASQKEKDSKVIMGSIDDAYISYESIIPDPYLGYPSSVWNLGCSPTGASQISRNKDGITSFHTIEINSEEYPQPQKLKVFLCYASQDKPIVHDLHQKLSTEGWIEPWLNTHNLLPGQDWQTEIKNAVEAADNVIIFLSNTSINKDGFVQKELRFAKDIALEKSEGSVFLIPLRLEECEVPRSLQNYQWVDYFGPEQEQTYIKLIKTLKNSLKDIKGRQAFTK